MPNKTNIEEEELTHQKVLEAMPRKWTATLSKEHGKTRTHWYGIVKDMRVDSPDWEHILNLLKKTKAERDARLEATKKAVA